MVFTFKTPVIQAFDFCMLQKLFDNIVQVSAALLNEWSSLGSRGASQARSTDRSWTTVVITHIVNLPHSVPHLGLLQY